MSETKSTSKTYVVIYEENEGGIATTERTTFDNPEEAKAYYAMKLEQKCAEVMLCIVIVSAIRKGNKMINL